MVQELKETMDETIKYNNFSQIVKILGETQLGVDYSKYTVKTKAGVRIVGVPGRPGLKNRAVMGYIESDKARPVLLGPSTAKSFTKVTRLISGWFGERGVVGGGTTGSGQVDTIDYVAISTGGGFADFGNLTEAVRRCGAASSGTLGLFIAGNGFNQDVISKITIATVADASSFGNSSTDMIDCTAMSDATVAIYGSVPSLSVSQPYDKLTIATDASAAFLTNMSANKHVLQKCSVNSSTFGYVCGGTGGSSDFTSKIFFANDSFSENFGTLTETPSNKKTGTGNSTRGLIGGGSDAIQYIDFATDSDFSDFGDLSAGIVDMAGIANNTLAVFCGGDSGGAKSACEKVAISTLGNSTTGYATLSQARSKSGGLSGKP